MAAYGLEEFIADMTALTQKQIGQQHLFEEGAVHLHRLLENPECLPDAFKRPSGRGNNPNHGSYALHRGPGLFISAVVWGPGDGIGPHDHRTWGMIGVLDNHIQESRYRIAAGNGSDSQALVKGSSTLLEPGDISFLTPEVDEIHSLSNSSDRPTVEIHVYGKDLVGLSRSRYDKSGVAHSFASTKYDNC